jgi:hypothetical protein
MRLRIDSSRKGDLNSLPFCVRDSRYGQETTPSVFAPQHCPLTTGNCQLPNPKGRPYLFCRPRKRSG